MSPLYRLLPHLPRTADVSRPRLLGPFLPLTCVPVHICPNIEDTPIFFHLSPGPMLGSNRCQEAPAFLSGLGEGWCARTLFTG